MGVNLKDEAKKMQAQVSGGAEAQPGIISPSRSFDVRAYRVTNEQLFNKTIAELEAMPQEVTDLHPAHPPRGQQSSSPNPTRSFVKMMSSQ